MRYIIPTIIMIFLLFAIPVSSSDWNRACVGSTLEKNMTIYFNNTAYIFNTTINCPYGCADNGLECAEPATSDSGMMLTICIVLGIIAALFAYIGKSITWGGESYSWMLQVLFMFGALLFILLDIGIIAGFSTFTQNNIRSILNVAYLTVIYIILLVLLAFMVLLVIKAVEYMISRGGKNKKD